MTDVHVYACEFESCVLFPYDAGTKPSQIGRQRFRETTDLKFLKFHGKVAWRYHCIFHFHELAPLPSIPSGLYLIRWNHLAARPYCLPDSRFCTTSYHPLKFLSFIFNIRVTCSAAYTFFLTFFLIHFVIHFITSVSAHLFISNALPVGLQ